MSTEFVLDFHPYEGEAAYMLPGVVVENTQPCLGRIKKRYQACSLSSMTRRGHREDVLPSLRINGEPLMHIDVAMDDSEN